jgi:hypothetical protein
MALRYSIPPLAGHRSFFATFEAARAGLERFVRATGFGANIKDDDGHVAMGWLEGRKFKLFIFRPEATRPRRQKRAA